MPLGTPEYSAVDLVSHCTADTEKNDFLSVSRDLHIIRDLASYSNVKERLLWPVGGAVQSRSFFLLRFLFPYGDAYSFRELREGPGISSDRARGQCETQQQGSGHKRSGVWSVLFSLTSF